MPDMISAIGAKSTIDRQVMIGLQDVTMMFPKPVRYAEFLTHPLAARRTTLALDNVSLRVAKGEHVGILGPNGAGKTTLLKLMAGILYPTKGKVLINGIDTIVNNLQARKNVAFVTNEERSFYWRLTGVENLRFFGALDNLFGRSLRQQIQQVMHDVGLGSVRDVRVSDYSSGMRQRLAIARALLTDPDVLLLDEPTRSLDLSGACNIRELLSLHAYGERPRTLIIMTNDIADAVSLCKRICILHDRRIAAQRDISGASSVEIEQFYHAAVDQTRADK